MITTVTLNSTIDIVTPVKKFIPGSVMRTKAIYAYPGGKGTNVARALATLGAEALSTGFVGIRDSHETIHFLKHHNVGSDYVICRGSNRICQLITETCKGGKETIINSESDMDITAKEKGMFLKKLALISKKSTHVVFSGSLPLEVPQDFYMTAIKGIRKNCAVMLDTSSKYLFHGIKACPHIIKMNIHELESAFNVRLAPFTGKTPSKVFKNFILGLSLKYYVPVIIVTLNDKGAILFDRGSFLFYPAINVKDAVSPVGSGDAFSAGFVYGLSKGLDSEEACKWGVACAAANLSQLGSCFFTKAQVKPMLKKVKTLKY